MPPLEAPHGPAKKKVRKAPLRPETAGNPNVAPRRVVRAKPAPAPKPTQTQIRSSRAQEQGYKSQGMAVRRVAQRQQTTARAKSTERGYRSQGQQVERAGNRQRRARKDLFENPVKGLSRAENRAVRSFSLLYQQQHDPAVRARRIKYLRAHRPTGIHFITKLSSDIARHVAHNAVITGTGGGPNFTKLAPHGKGSGVATALAPHGALIRKSKVGTRVVEDLLNLPAQSVATGYDVGAAAVEAAHGDTKRAKRIVKSVKQSDPIYNTVAAGVSELKGDKKGASKHLQRAKKSVTEHPGFAVVEVLGAKGTAGRLGGRLARTGLLGKTVKRAGSTERAARTVEHTRIREPRDYSGDIITKGRQVGMEKARRAVARKMETRARHKPTDRAEELRHKAAKVRGDRVPEKEIQRQVDEHVAAQEDVRRIHRAKVVKRVHQAAKHANHATVVVAQRITHASHEDIRAYIKELEGEYPTLSKAGQRANRELRQGLEKALKGGNLDRVEQEAQAYREVTAPLQKKLVKRKLLSRDQEAKAKLIPYAVRRMGATHDAEKGLVVERKVVRVRDGKRTVTTEKTPLRTEVIRAHMHGEERSIRREIRQAEQRLARMKPGTDTYAALRRQTEHLYDRLAKARAAQTEPAFVTQAPNQRGARNFNVRSERPVTITGPKRTGEATRKGTFDANPEVLTEQAARTQGLVDATDGFRSFVKRFAHRGDSGKLKTFKNRKAAETYAREHALEEGGTKRPGAVALRPVRVNPWGATNEQLRNLIEEADTPEAQRAVTEAMHDALEGKPGPGKWALVPEAAAKRMQDHLNVQGGAGGLKTLQLANQTFRRTVLATSTGWLTGNGAEGLVRAALMKAGPRSFITAHRGLKELKRIDPKEYDQAIARAVPGGHYGSASKLHVRRGAEQFEGTKLAPVATALGKFWRLPGPKQAAGFWNTYTEWVFNSVNGFMESQIQKAMLGKILRDSPLLDGHLLKTGKAAARDAAQGLRNTDNQIAYGRLVARAYGKYSAFPPWARRAIATYTPFAAWLYNAIYFTFRVMPRDHPTVTGLLAALENANQDWRKSHGLDLFMDSALPGFLQGSIPLKGGAHLRVNRYTPAGAFGDLAGTAAGQVNPLFSGVIAALEGRDWKGDTLRVKGANGKTRDANEMEKAVFAAQALAEATVPAYSVGQQIKQGGLKALNPAKVTKSKPRASTGGAAVIPKGITFGSGSSSSGIQFGPGGSSTTINP